MKIKFVIGVFGLFVVSVFVVVYVGLLVDYFNKIDVDVNGMIM